MRKRTTEAISTISNVNEHATRFAQNNDFLASILRRVWASGGSGKFKVPNFCLGFGSQYRKCFKSLSKNQEYCSDCRRACEAAETSAFQRFMENIKWIDEEEEN